MGFNSGFKGLNRGANLTVLQPLVLRNWSPITLQSCQKDIPLAADTFISVLCLRF